MKLAELRRAWLIAAAIGAATADVSSAQTSELPDLLIVGSPHLANPNRDMVASRVPDVLTADRQRELEALTTALARYRPTRIAVEVQTKDRERLNARYAAYRQGGASQSSGELEQVAFRLASKLNLPSIEAVDWNGAPPMAEADYNFQTWADENGRGDELKAVLRRGEQAQQTMQGGWNCTPVGNWYRQMNTPAYRAADNKIYFDIAMLGEPGPNWVGGSWHMRNLRIFAQLRRTAQPKDRVLVLFGAGHGYLLDRFARESGAFTVSDTMAYLPKRAPARC